MNVRQLLLIGVAVLLCGSFGLAQVNTGPGSPQDVARALGESPGPWADEAIELAVSRGLFIGYPDTSFDWQRDATRAELAVVIARLVQTYGLEDYDPAALAALREAVAGLEGDLDALRAVVDQHAGRLDDTATALNMQEDELMQLWAAVEALQAAPVQFDAANLWLAIGNLEDRTTANEAAIAELRALLLQEDGAGDLAALQDRIAALEAAMAAADADRASFSSSLLELVERVNALEGNPDIIVALQGDLVLIGDRLNDLESRVTALETELALAQETLADHEERLASWRFERQVDLIIDLPLGFALQTVPELANPAVVVTSCEAAGYLNDLQRLEPSAIIVNPESTVNLRKPLQSVAEGQRVYVGPSLPDLQLMPREWEVWQRVATGADNDGIATALGVTRKTVANYVTNLQEKLGVRGRTGLMLTYWGHPATG